MGVRLLKLSAALAVLVYDIKYFDYISWQLQPALDEEDSLVNTDSSHSSRLHSSAFDKGIRLKFEDKYQGVRMEDTDSLTDRVFRSCNKIVSEIPFTNTSLSHTHTKHATMSRWATGGQKTLSS